MSEKDERDEHKSLQTSAPSASGRICHSLQHSKDVEKLKSQVRLCVMRVLTERLSKPAVFPKIDNALLTELIVEYLEWMGYNRTLETFRTECRLPKERDVSILNNLKQLQSHSSDNVLPQIFLVVNKCKETSD